MRCRMRVQTACRIASRAGPRPRALDKATGHKGAIMAMYTPEYQPTGEEIAIFKTGVTL